jgi:hypothetical protein
VLVLVLVVVVVVGVVVVGVVVVVVVGWWWVQCLRASCPRERQLSILFSFPLLAALLGCASRVSFYRLSTSQ